MSTIQTNAIVDAAGGNTTTVNGISPLANSARFARNLIINGGMQVAQRGTSSLTINSGSLQYPCDRFAGRGVSSAGVFTLQQVTDSPAGFINSLKATVTTADSSLSGTESYRILQHIEGNNISHLNWGSSDNQTATLSFKVKSSLTGTFGGAVQNGDYNRFVPFSYTISNANTWEDKTVTITGDTTGTYQTDHNLAVRLNWSLGAAQLGTAGTYSSSALNGVTGQTQVISTNGATFQITGVQLELGSVATDFDQRSYANELSSCERYYQLSIANTGYTNSSTSCRLSIAGKTTMRATPTLAIANGTGTCEDYGAGNRNITGLGGLSGGTVHGGLADATIASSTSGKSHALMSGAIAMIAEL